MPFILALVTLIAILAPVAAITIPAVALWISLGPFYIGESGRWLGRIARGRLHSADRDLLDEYPMIVHFTIGWLNGVFLLYVISVAAWLLNLFSVLLLLGVAVVFFSIFALKNLSILVRRPGGSFGTLLQQKWTSILLVTLAAVTVMMTILRGFSPPPYQVGWDMFQHSYISNQITEMSRFSPLLSGLSNSIVLDAYTTSFHLVVSMAGGLGQGDSLLVFWIGPVFTLLLFALGTAFLARRLKLDSVVILSAVAFGVAFQEWNKGSSLVYLSPGSLVTAFAPIILGIQLSYPKINRVTSVHLAAASILLIQFITGGILLIIAYSIPLLRSVRRRADFKPWIAPFGLLLLAIAVILIPLVGWQAYNSLFGSITEYFVTLGSVFWRVGLRWKVDALTAVWYTLPLLGAGIAGLLLRESRALVTGSSMRNPRLSFVTLVMLAGLLMYYIELEQTSRVLFLVKPGLILLAALFCAEIGRTVSISKQRLVTVGIVGTILISASFPAFTFMNRQRLEGDTNGIATSFIDYEMEMGSWIKANLPDDILVLSDPRTQDLIQSFALRETLFGFEMPLDDQAQLRMGLLSGSSETAAIAIREIVVEHGYEPSKTYLVVSGRTVVWADSNQVHVFRPKTMTDFSIVDMLNPPQFGRLHSVQNQIFLFSLGTSG